MVDNNGKPDQNQDPEPWDNPKPIYESVPGDVQSEQPADQAAMPENLQPEAVSDEINNPQEATAAYPTELPPDQLPPVPVYEENKMRYFIIGGGIVFFLIIFILILSLLVPKKKSSTNITLTYWGLWEDKETMDPLISDYQAKNPNIKIEYKKYAPQDYRDKLLTQSKKGKGPDIFRFHNTWIPEIQELMTSVPSQVMSTQEYEKTFYKSVQKDLKVGDNYYGIPLYIDNLVLICNNAMLKAAGISQPPTTWEQIPDAAAQMVVRQGASIQKAGIALGTTSNVEHFSDIFGLLLLQNGGDINKLDAPEAAQALQVYRSFAENENTAVWDESMDNSITAFAKGNVGMIIAPSWEVLTIKAIAPDLDIKVAPVPTLSGLKPVTISSYWVEGVSRYSQNQLEAWKFLKYLSEKEQETKLFELQSKTRLFGGAYSRVDLADSLAQNPYLSVVVQQAENMQSVPISSRTFDNGLNDGLINYIGDAINASAQGVSYGEAMSRAQQGAQQVLNKYKINQ